MKKTLLNNKKKNKKYNNKYNNTLKGGSSVEIPSKPKQSRNKVILSYNDDDTHYSVNIRLPYIEEQKTGPQKGSDNVFFNASKLSDNNIGFWSNYSNEQELMSRRIGIPNKNFGITDGNGSFSHSLSMFNEKNDFDIWIIYASSKLINDKDSEIIRGMFIEKNGKSNLYQYESDKRIDCDSIEMCFSLFIDKISPITTHMGIFRNWKYFSNGLFNIKSHKNLSSYLHSFSAKISQLLYKNKKYMITNPVNKMREIFKKSLIEYHKSLTNNNIKLENIVVIGDNKLRNEIRKTIKHKYNSEPDNIKKIIDKLEEIFIEIETNSGEKLSSFKKKEIIDYYFSSSEFEESDESKSLDEKEKKKISKSIKNLNNNKNIKSYNDYKGNPFMELLPTDIDYNPPLHYIDDNTWSISYKDEPTIEFKKPDWFRHRDLLNHLPTIIVDVNHLANMHFKDYILIDDYHEN
jgi:hypothetical protein